MSGSSFLMIGKQGSGKTSYLAAAYGLMSRGINGFQLKANNPTDKLQLDTMFCDLKNGEYPMATNKRISYELSLSYTGVISYLEKFLNSYAATVFGLSSNSFLNSLNRMVQDYPITTFKWKDFYGGIMSTPNIDEVDALKNEMKESAGLMLFFDASELIVNKAQSIHRIIKLISQNINGIETVFHINIILTKCDLVYSDSSFTTITDPLLPLINIVKKNPNIVLNINKVSCSQHGLINIEIPVFQLFDFVLKLEIKVNEEKINEERRLLDNAEKEAGVFDDVISFFASETSWRELAEKHRENISNISHTQSYIKRIESKVLEYLNNNSPKIYI